MKTEKKIKDKLGTIRGVIDSWETGGLSDGAAWVAITLVVCPQPKPTKEVIEHAKKLQPLARKVLARG